jgi:hypothetical protein
LKVQIQVQDTTREALKKKGLKGETFDDVITRLITQAEKK